MSWTVELRSLRVSRSDGTALVGPHNLTLSSGRVHALAGESGSGKTLTLRALAGVVPEGLVGSMNEGGRPLPRTAMVFQDPASFFNPRWRVRRSLGEVLSCVRGIRGRSAASAIAGLADAVGLTLDELRRFPFELSGGMVQRAGIAMALATEPELLLADEITSALDPALSERILAVLTGIARSRDLAVILVSHDIQLLARVADTVSILYRGLIVEEGNAQAVFTTPAHPYTDFLVRALPSAAARGRPLPEIPVVDEGDRDEGCPFRYRCPRAVSACRVMPPWDASRRVRCHRPLQTAPAGESREERRDAL
jgi:oligopeptide/dipeptide ABC transporter ATP-binding protein